MGDYKTEKLYEAQRQSRKPAPRPRKVDLARPMFLGVVLFYIGTSVEAGLISYVVLVNPIFEGLRLPIAVGIAAGSCFSFGVCFIVHGFWRRLSTATERETP